MFFNGLIELYYFIVIFGFDVRMLQCLSSKWTRDAFDDDHPRILSAQYKYRIIIIIIIKDLGQKREQGLIWKYGINQSPQLGV